MVDVTVADDLVVFAVEGLDKLWSFRSRLELPLAHVTAVEHDPKVVGRWWHGVKVLGTDVPGLFAAGTFYYHGELVFWDVQHSERAIIVSLQHERFKKLIVEVADPHETVTRLRQAIRTKGTPVPLRDLRVGDVVETAYERGWSNLTNGGLLDAAEAASFEVLITIRISGINRSSDRRLVIIVLPTTRWPEIQRHTGDIRAALTSIRTGEFLQLKW